MVWGRWPRSRRGRGRHNSEISDDTPGAACDVPKQCGAVKVNLDSLPTNNSQDDEIVESRQSRDDELVESLLWHTANDNAV
jgi:hypothetical protein